MALQPGYSANLPSASSTQSPRNVPVADKCIDTVIAGTETAQLHFLAVLNLLRVAVAPLDRYVRVGIGIDQHIECAITSIELW